MQIDVLNVQMCWIQELDTYIEMMCFDRMPLFGDNDMRYVLERRVRS